MTKLQAMEYLMEHNVYGNEWQGAGMWEATERVMRSRTPITIRWLTKLLKEAEDR